MSLAAAVGATPGRLITGALTSAVVLGGVGAIAGFANRGDDGKIGFDAPRETDEGIRRAAIWTGAMATLGAIGGASIGAKVGQAQLGMVLGGFASAVVGAAGGVSYQWTKNSID